MAEIKNTEVVMTDSQIQWIQIYDKKKVAPFTCPCRYYSFHSCYCDRFCGITTISVFLVNAVVHGTVVTVDPTTLICNMAERVLHYHTIFRILSNFVSQMHLLGRCVATMLYYSKSVGWFLFMQKAQNRM